MLFKKIFWLVEVGRVRRENGVLEWGPGPGQHVSWGQDQKNNIQAFSSFEEARFVYEVDGGYAGSVQRQSYGASFVRLWSVQCRSEELSYEKFTKRGARLLAEKSLPVD